jgi:uncharacterized repeat protein (TIGR03803 family)
MKKNQFLLLILFILGIGACNAQYADLLDFAGANGSSPKGSVILNANKLYGMTGLGGTAGKGCVFSMDSNGGGYKKLVDFAGANGSTPYYSKLMLIRNTLYGMTYLGGANNDGCVFSVDTNGSNYKDMLDFTGSNGQYPYGSLTLVGNLLYGMTFQGGLHNDGCIFTLDTNGGGYKDLYDFTGASGQNPCGTLTLSGKVLFGTTEYGGANGNGCIFSIDSNGTKYKDMLDFGDQAAPLGANPTGSLIVAGHTLFGLASAGGLQDLGCAFSIDTNGSNYKELIDFNAAKGYFPFGDLTRLGNVLYGMTSNGDASNKGSIFSVDTNGGSFTLLLNFSTTTFSNPFGSLTPSGNNFYGMTSAGGASADGVIFKFNYVTAGINDVNVNSSEVKLFPDPNHGRFTIEPSVTGNQLSFEIYNLLGAMVYKSGIMALQNGNSLQIDMDGHPAGIYLYRLINIGGSLISSGKFSIQ